MSFIAVSRSARLAAPVNVTFPSSSVVYTVPCSPCTHRSPGWASFPVSGLMVGDCSRPWGLYFAPC